MYVPYEIKLKGTDNVVAEQGYQLITGDTAELILRNRNFPLQDYQRLETQQYFYLALFNAFKANPQDFIKGCSQLHSVFQHRYECCRSTGVGQYRNEP